MYQLNPLLESYINPISFLSSIGAVVTGIKVTNKVNKILDERSKRNLMLKLQNDKHLFDKLCLQEISASRKFLNDLVTNKEKYLTSLYDGNIRKYNDEISSIKYDISDLNKIYRSYDYESLVNYLKTKSKSNKTLSIILGIIAATAISLGSAYLSNKYLRK